MDAYEQPIETQSMAATSNNLLPKTDFMNITYQAGSELQPNTVLGQTRDSHNTVIVTSNSTEHQNLHTNEHITEMHSEAASTNLVLQTDASTTMPNEANSKPEHYSVSNQNDDFQAETTAFQSP